MTGVKRKRFGFPFRPLDRFGRERKRQWFLGLVILVAALGFVLFSQGPTPLTAATPDMYYTNYRLASVPWSIHVVRVDRTNGEFEVRSVHAEDGALGLDTLSSQAESVRSPQGIPFAAVNGDFYQRGHTFAGDPRGLQIVDGEVISAPIGDACFWIDAEDQPHADNVESRFQITWPDGQTSSFGLNEDRRNAEIVLYTSALGASTRTSGGRELVLERSGKEPWLPLRMGETYSARVRDIRDGGNSRLTRDIMVLSIGGAMLRSLPKIEAGTTLKISTGSTPSLRGAKTGIGGGPVLIQDGKRQKIRPPSMDSYEFRSMLQRHPRSAFGWSKNAFFMVGVDGRQRNVSVGMTLDELAAFMFRLGCEGAINLDGGGSATFWYNGRVRNRPCDGHERDIANSLVIVKKIPESAPTNSDPPKASP